MDAIRIKELQSALSGQTEVLIIPHNDPDPDAIGTALALRFFLKEKFSMPARIAYCGLIGRAENRALMDYLEHPLDTLAVSDLCEEVAVALVDTQPGTGNNPLPDHIIPLIVVDHHPRREETSAVRFADIREDVGASGTILTAYLRAANLEPPPSLATALFYGIKTDTMSLGRGAGPDDMAAYFYLQSRIDVDALVAIERAQVPPSYFESLATALQAAHIYDGDLVMAYLGEMNYPDLGAEIADLLLRLEGINWVICMGAFDKNIFLSVRSRSDRIGASELVRGIVGDLGTAGGHGAMAGGQVPIQGTGKTQLIKKMEQNALRHLGKDSSQDGLPLVSTNC